MERKYSLNDLALMTGLTTRTLRNYLSQGFLHGEKTNGVWQFTDAELDRQFFFHSICNSSDEMLDRFFADPFVKEGLRIKRSSAVFDFLADRNREKARSCVILDIPASRKEGDKISAFFCDRMRDASDACFHYGWDNGLCRVILSGAADSVASIMHAYSITDFND